jgi:prepilin-type N-terminal cleavage/methylation domain-containing protein
MALVRQNRRHAPGRGFTLVELAVCITVIGVVAALIIPAILNSLAESKKAAAAERVAQLARIFKRFHDDTIGWPYEGFVWRPDPQYPIQQINPTQFNPQDTALFSRPFDPQLGAAEPLCNGVPPGPSHKCWNGPYVGTGSSMGDVINADPWGNPLYYALIRPSDSWGGGTSVAPAGFIVVWSAGPDGVDQTGCSGGGCSFDITKLASGQSSSSDSDDLVYFVGTAF